MQLTKRHLRVFDNYQGKKSSLEKVGSPKEKELFQNGEFEKIQRFPLFPLQQLDYPNAPSAYLNCLRKYRGNAAYSLIRSFSNLDSVSFLGS